MPSRFQCRKLLATLAACVLLFCPADGRSADTEPLYVSRLEPENHRVVVGPYAALATAALTLKEVNWLAQGEGPPAGGAEAMVKCRSTMEAVPATVFGGTDGACRVVFDRPQHGIAPGQACVFYDGNRVLGGGWIDTQVGASVAVPVPVQPRQAAGRRA